MTEQLEIEAKQRKSWDWEPDKREFPLRPKSGNVDASLATLASAIYDSNGSMTEACIEPGWRVGDIILAARVLQGDSPAPNYKDEAEMRRVFGLVYDVLRYKQILNQALQDVGFWYRYSEHMNREKIVWLLLYDMQGRKFSRRHDTAILERRERAFRQAGIKDIEDALIETRTRLAASVSRLRIGGSALALDELLPAHLRSAEGINWNEDGACLASGWVNTIKISSKAEFIGEMSKLELRLCSNCNETELDEDHYVFDPICPKVVNLHDKAREKLAMSDLVTSHRFIFLERSLCLGAAALAQTIRCGRLCGPVVLTHTIAPRHTGYLAGLISDIEDAGRLLAFGTGEKRHQYEDYLGKLGLTTQQCRVFAEKYVAPPPLAELERATIVLCPPPCSYTGVKDVVDLAVARGGDTKLLETLTEIDIELEQPKTLLTEQLTTLKYALTRPNVQLLIYEAHSILPSETFEMVDQVVQHANQMAADKYVREHPPKKIKQPNKETSAKMTRSGKTGKRTQSLDQKNESQEEKRIEDEEEMSTRASADFEVPESDIFEIGSPIDIYGTESAKWLNEGCYLAVIKRKEMMQFNSLFMIKVAESKGLFGDPTKQRQESPKEERVVSPARQGSLNSGRKGFKRPKIQVDRIAAATHSSILRSSRSRKRENGREKAACPRHVERVRQDEILSRSQIPGSPVPSQSSRTSDVPLPKVSEREKSQTKINGQDNRSNELIERILSEKTWRKNSKVAFSGSNRSNALRLFSMENTPPMAENRFLVHENHRSKSDDNRNSSTFSFGYGAKALANATQKIYLKNNNPKISDYERDKENSWEYKIIQQTSGNPVENRKSRLYHPGGSLRYSRPEVSTNSKSPEYYQGFYYVYPGTGNAAAAAGLDNSPTN